MWGSQSPRSLGAREADPGSKWETFFLEARNLGDEGCQLVRSRTWAGRAVHGVRSSLSPGVYKLGSRWKLGEIYKAHT